MLCSCRACSGDGDGTQYGGYWSLTLSYSSCTPCLSHPVVLVWLPGSSTDTLGNQLANVGPVYMKTAVNYSKQVACSVQAITVHSFGLTGDFKHVDQGTE